MSTGTTTPCYRSPWAQGTALVAAWGLGLAFLCWPPLVTLQVAAVLTATVGMLVCLAAPRCIRSWGVVGIAAASAHASAGCLGLVALSALSPALGAFAGLTTLATSPVARSVVVARTAPALRRWVG